MGTSKVQIWPDARASIAAAWIGVRFVRAALDAPMAEFGGLWPGYVSGAHHGVPGPGYGHPFLRPGDLERGHIYALVSYNNSRTNFVNVHPSEFVVRYSFGMHRGDWREGQAGAFGRSVTNPPLAVWMQGPQEGTLPESASFCEVDAGNVMAVTLKRAEDGNGRMIVKIKEARMPGPGMELIGEEEKRELLEVLEGGYFFRYGSPDDPAFKAKVYTLEQEVAKHVGVHYAVAVNSGTMALVTALMGLGIGAGDEVIVPGYTFIASISTIAYARAVPILAEVDSTLNKEAIADLPGLEFREITDPDGECATLLTVFLPSTEVARKVAKELGTKVIADSGWHVYSNMEQILDKRMPTAEEWPDTHPLYVNAGGSPVQYWRGMLPQTDDLLSRAVNLSIGVWDAGLGSAFGVTMSDGFDTVDARAQAFKSAVAKYL